MKSVVNNPRKLQDQQPQIQSFEYPSVFSPKERNSPVEEYKDGTGSQFGGKDKAISEEQLMEYMSGQEDMYGEYGISDDDSSLAPKGGKRKKKSKKNKKTKRSRKTRGAKRGRHVNRSRKTRKGKRQNRKKRHTRRGTR